MRKKIFALMMVLTMAVSVSGCDIVDKFVPKQKVEEPEEREKKDKKDKDDDSKEKKSLADLLNKKTDPEPGPEPVVEEDDWFECDSSGVKIKIPDVVKENKDKYTVQVYDTMYFPGVYFVEGDVYPGDEKAVEELLSGQVSDKLNAISDNSRLVFAMFVFDGGAGAYPQDYIGDYGDTDEYYYKRVHSEDGREYFTVNMTDYVNIDLTETFTQYLDLDPDDYNSFVKEVNAELTKALDTAEYGETKMQTGAEGAFTFSTTDVYGNSVTSDDLFGEYDYTLVNVWASWCGPCVGELQEIDAMYKEYKSAGIGVVGLLYDGDEAGGLSDGVDTLEDLGITYPNIIIPQGFDDYMYIYAFPTSFIVDRNGNIVGEQIVGADPDAYRSALDALTGQ